MTTADEKLAGLAVRMAEVRDWLEDLPEDVEWMPDGLAAVEDIRFKALQLARSAEAILEAFRGGPGD